MKTNIHIYPSPMTHESRIMREAQAIERMGIFAAVELIGVLAGDLPAQERVSDAIRILRLRPRKGGGGLAKLALHLLWCLNVLQHCLRARPACVNCHSLTVLPIGVVVKLVCRSKLVYDTHELETETNGLGGIRKSASKMMEKMLVRFADHAIFVGEAIEAWYRKAYGITNTAVVYNAPAARPVEPNDYFRRRFSIADSTRIFLYLGVLSPGRGVDLLLQAFSGLDGAAIVFMGYGLLERRIAEIQAARDNVFLHEAVPPDRLLQLAAAADFGVSIVEPVSLSYEYAMPNKLFEYIMAGIPVLVSPTHEQKMMVERHGIGIVAGSLAADDIRAAAKELLASPPHRFAAGLESARRRFSWSTQEATLRDVYLDRLGFGRS